MKIKSLNLITGLLLCFSLNAQDQLADKAVSALFENSLSNLSIYEKTEILKLSGFQLADNGRQFYLNDDPEIKGPFDIRVYPLDLNDDGIEEIAIEYGNFDDSDQAFKKTLLFVKDMEGNYVANFGKSGTFVFLNINSFTLPDVVIKSREPGYPVWRWNGMKYQRHDNYNRKRLRKMRITYLADASKAYSTLVKKK